MPARGRGLQAEPCSRDASLGLQEETWLGESANRLSAGSEGKMVQVKIQGWNSAVGRPELVQGRIRRTESCPKRKLRCLRCRELCPILPAGSRGNRGYRQT